MVWGKGPTSILHFCLWTISCSTKSWKAPLPNAVSAPLLKGSRSQQAGLFQTCQPAPPTSVSAPTPGPWSWSLRLCGFGVGKCESSNFVVFLGHSGYSGCSAFPYDFRVSLSFSEIKKKRQLEFWQELGWIRTSVGEYYRLNIHSFHENGMPLPLI